MTMLDRLVPHGQFVTRSWLLQQGVSRHTLDNALKSKKLVSLARGVVTRDGPAPDWKGCAASLNRIMPPVYVGGLSAIEQHGLAHNIPMQQTITLYSPQQAPSWLNQIETQSPLTWHSTNTIWSMTDLSQSNNLKQNLIYKGYWLIATAEQAVIELLPLVPGQISFELADQLIQGLVNLSPNRLNKLLLACKNVKAKRLFFFFADRYNYAWRQKLRPGNYDLGKGKRQLVSGGKYISKYQITVPHDFYG